MRTYLSCVAVALGSFLFFACGGSVSNKGGPSSDQDASDDGGMTADTGGGMGDAADAGADVDHGDASDVYPAFAPAFGQIPDQGGYVMQNPIIVPITWDGDPAQASFDTFADTLGGTTYWQATTSEYGIGPAVSGTANHVHLTTAAPATISDSGLRSLISANAGVTGSGWPAPTADTIYIFFVAPTTSLLVGGGGGDACAAGEGGYHSETSVGGMTVTYAVVASCGNFHITPSAADQSMASATHEIIESATDPQPRNPAYYGFRNQDFAWDYFYQIQDTEVGDACEFFGDSFFQFQETTPDAFTSFVQRTWSNKAGLAGHDPCVPELPGEVYFNVTPFNMEMVNVALPPMLGSGTQATLGYKIPAGSSGTFQVGFYSEADTVQPWTITARTSLPSRRRSTRRPASTARRRG
jgi:hypothetical protein